MKQANDEQIAALQRFAKLNGRKWKEILLAAWMNGSYRHVIALRGDDALLQQVRNQLGLSWLAKFRLPETLAGRSL